VKLEEPGTVGGGGGVGLPGGGAQSMEKKKRKRRVKKETMVADDEDSEEDCAARRCLKPLGEVNWVQCDRCEAWFHLLCVGLAEDEVSEDVEYECFTCKQQRGIYPPDSPDIKTEVNPQMTATAGKPGSVYGVTLNDVSVIKPELDMDNVLVCNEEVEVSLDSQKSDNGYNGVGEGYSGSDTQSKNQTSMSSKVTQFSYNETDDSSQDEVKSNYSVGIETRDLTSLSTQIPTSLEAESADSQQ